MRDSRYVVGLRRPLGALVVVFGLVTSIAAAGGVESVSLASAKPGYTVFPGGRSQSFQVRASNGYTLFVRSIGRNRILVNATSREADVAYVAPADITARSISAWVPHLGRVTMRFHPSGPPEPSPEPQGDCRGRRALVQDGTFVGHLRWRGERGYTSARATRASGYLVHSFREGCKGEGAGVGDEGLIVPLLVARSRTADRFVELQAYGEKGEVPSFTVLVEETQPKLEIYRFLSGAQGEIDVNPSGVIEVIPRPPFHGTAEFQPTQGAKGSWTGTLTAVFPGKGAVSLAGPTFSVRRAPGWPWADAP